MLPTGIQRLESSPALVSRLALPNANDPAQAALAVANIEARRSAIAVLNGAFPGLPLGHSAQATDATTLTVGRATDALRIALDSEEFLGHLLGQFSLMPGIHLKLVRDRETRRLDDIIAASGPEEPTQLRVAALAGALDDGYTLVLDGIEIRHPASVILAGLFERVFGCTVNINGYLSTRNRPSFGAHWDDQEVVILQLLGHKEWTIEAPVDLSMNQVAHGSTVSGRTVWQGRIGPGDALYVPRGWGHLASGVDELTYHHTITIPRLNGLRVLDALLMELASDRKADEPRLPLPLLPGFDLVPPLPIDCDETDRAVRKVVARSLFNIPRRSVESLQATVKTLDADSLDDTLVRSPAPGGWTVADLGGAEALAGIPPLPNGVAPSDVVVGGQAGQFILIPRRFVDAVAALTNGSVHAASTWDPDLVRSLVRLGVLDVVSDAEAWGLTFA